MQLENPTSNRFTLVIPKSENDVRTQAALEPHVIFHGSSQYDLQNREIPGGQSE